MASDYFVRWRDNEKALQAVAEHLAYIERSMDDALSCELPTTTRTDLSFARGLCEGMRAMIDRRPS